RPRSPSTSRCRQYSRRRRRIALEAKGSFRELSLATPEICLFKISNETEFVPCSSPGHLAARREDVRSVSDLACSSDLLFDKKHGHALTLQLSKQVEDV